MLVADFGKDVVKHAYFGIFIGGNVKPRLCHSTKKPRCFQSYGLTSRIGSRDNQHIIVSAQLYRDGDYGLGIKERVSCTLENKLTFISHSGSSCLHDYGKVSFGKDKVKQNEVTVV